MSCTKRNTAAPASHAQNSTAETSSIRRAGAAEALCGRPSPGATPESAGTVPSSSVTKFDLCVILGITAARSVQIMTCSPGASTCTGACLPGHSGAKISASATTSQIRQGAFAAKRFLRSGRRSRSSTIAALHMTEVFANCSRKYSMMSSSSAQLVEVAAQLVDLALFQRLFRAQGCDKALDGAAVQPGGRLLTVVFQVGFPVDQRGIEVAAPLPADREVALFAKA